MIVQQLDYWMKKEGVGVIVDGIKYVYNTYRDWTRQQFRWLSERQFRTSMSLLRSHSIVEVIQHKSKRWNQTNYYSLNYSRLKEFLKEETGESIEIAKLTVKADRSDKKSQIEMTNLDTSLYEAKITAKEETAKQSGNRFSDKIESIAVAPSEEALEREESQKEVIPIQQS